MRFGTKVGAVLLCCAGIAGVSSASIAVMGGPVPVVQLQAQAGHHSAAGAHAHRSHPVVRRAVWHVMPHRIMPHPYLFHRPFIMRRLFRSNRGG